MTTISEGVNPWRPSVELAVVPAEGAPVAIGSGDDTGETDGFKIFGDDGFTFLDFLDIINPLQHIPIVATFYREMSGDSIDPGSRVIGDTLFLGPVGTFVSLANVIIDDATGKDMGEHVMAFFEGEESGYPEVSDAGNEPVAVSAAPPEAPGSPGAIDPVTAWAMAETSYRKSAAGKAAAIPARGDAAPYRNQASAAAATALSETVEVANWAMAEASYRKSAAVSSPVSQTINTVKPAPAPYAEAPPKAPRSGADALAALRRDLKAGAVVQAAEAAATLAAASYDRTRNPAPGSGKPADPPPGAIAAQGGWFTDTLLSALEKHDTGAAPGGTAVSGNRRPSSIDLAR